MTRKAAGGPGCVVGAMVVVAVASVAGAWPQAARAQDGLLPEPPAAVEPAPGAVAEPAVEELPSLDGPLPGGELPPVPPSAAESHAAPAQTPPRQDVAPRETGGVRPPAVEQERPGVGEVGRNALVAGGVALGLQGSAAVGLAALVAGGLVAGLVAVVATMQEPATWSQYGVSTYQWLVSGSPWYLFLPMTVGALAAAAGAPLLALALGGGGAVATGVVTWLLLDVLKWRPARSVLPAWSTVVGSSVGHALLFAPLWLAYTVVFGVVTAGNVLFLMLPGRALSATGNLSAASWGACLSYLSCAACCVALPPGLLASHVILALASLGGLGGSVPATVATAALSSAPMPTRRMVRQFFLEVFPEDEGGPAALDEDGE